MIQSKKLEIQQYSLINYIQHQEIPPELGIQIALLIYQDRIPGTIDFPAFAMKNPNFKLEDLKFDDSNTQTAAKPGKVVI
jgi:hypothetical protein